MNRLGACAAIGFAGLVEAVKTHLFMRGCRSVRCLALALANQMSNEADAC